MRGRDDHKNARPGEEAPVIKKVNGAARRSERRRGYRVVSEAYDLTSSTRRLLARPSAVLFSPDGLVSPYPLAVSWSAFTP